jgi:ABC-type multidrug transport system fused ATPase/permease subunit
VETFQEQINDLQILINDLRVDMDDAEIQGRQYLVRAIRLLSDAVIDLQLRVEAIEAKTPDLSHAIDEEEG